MAGSAKDFGRKLTDALETIKTKTRRSLTDVKYDIGIDLGYKGSETLEKWRQGKSLPNPKRLERLTRILVNPTDIHNDWWIEPTGFDRRWFDEFLKYGDYPPKSRERLLKELFSRDQGHLPQSQLPIVPPEQPPRMGSTLVGREAQLSALQLRLAVAHFAIVTGMPGVGKTALVGTLAERSARPSECLFWYTLRGSEGLDDIIYRLASFLAYYGQPTFLQLLQQGHRQPNSMLLDQILLTLSEKEGYLLCFDDFHRLDDGALINQILTPLLERAKRGDFDLLIISREMPKGIYCMKPFTVDGLDQEAVPQLLSQLNLSLSEEMQTVLYQLTQGNPQLLILAQSILEQQQNLGNLLKRIAGEVDIQRFMMAEVDVNLNDKEQHMMQATAICMEYPAPYRLIEAIADRGNLRNALNNLCNRHLMRIHNDADEIRYSQHGIVQQFYYGQIQYTECQAMHLRGAYYYRAVEQDSFKAAVHYEKAGEFERAAAQLVGDHTLPLVYQGQAVAAGKLLDSLQKKLPADPMIQTNVYHARGTYNRIQGAYESAITAFSAGFEQGDDPLCQIEFLYQIARVYRNQGAFDKALETSERIMAIYKQNPALAMKPKILKGIGWIYERLGKLEQAKDYFRQAWGEDGSTLASETAADTLLGIGTVESRLGHFDVAEKHFLESRERFKEIGNPIGQAHSLNNLGIVYREQGQNENALDCMETMLEVFESLGDIHSLIIGYYNIAIFYIFQKQYSAAESYLSSGSALAQRTHNYLMLCRFQASLAEVAMYCGRLEAATAHLDMAKQWEQRGGHDAEQGILYYVSGVIALAQGENKLALQFTEKAIPLLEKTYEADFLAPAQAVKEQALAACQID